MTYASRFLLGLFALLALAAPSHGHEEHSTARPPWQAASVWPDRVIATLSDDPTTSFAVTWRTDESVGRTIAQIAPASADARFDLNAISVRAKTERVVLDRVDDPRRTLQVIENQGLAPTHHHAAVFTGLEPDTLYAYRVRGGPGAWSPWRQIRTAPADDQPVSFLFFGDAQTGIRSHITRVFDTAAQVAPNAQFAIHGGDLVNTAMYDKEWAEWFGALGRTAMTIPSIPVTGNHDYVNLSEPGLSKRESKLFSAPKRVSPLWRPQFTLPRTEGLPADLAETVYDVRYGPLVHVFVLDSSGVAWDEQLEWLADQLKTTDAAWRIVTMHHPLFSFVGGTEHPAARERRLALLALLETSRVDMILTGHRHTYQRGVYGGVEDGPAAGERREIDTLFVVTASSTKRGESKVEGWRRYQEETGGDFRLDRYADNTPIFARLEASTTTLSFAAFDATGEAYDAFHLTRGEDGALRVEDAAEANAPLRTLENTGRYAPWDDLR